MGERVPLEDFRAGEDERV
jgi:hypothetical protein